MTETVTAVKSRYGWPSIVVAIVFGVLYAYVLWTAIGNISQLPGALGAHTPWPLLILDVALPPIVFAAAFWIGRRHPLPARAVFFFIGLAVLASATVGSVGYVQTL
jgi:hypothetical protein